MLGRLRTVLGGQQRTEVYLECRHCGCAVEDGAEECPTCEQAAIVRYELR